MITLTPSQLKPVSASFKCALLLALAGSLGCEVDSYMDPSTTGYWEFAPTTIPVLERIDVIETDEKPFGEISPPTPEDLVPKSLQYTLAPGDIVRTEIYELVVANQMDIKVSVVDQAGQIRLPTLGDVPAAGLTLEGLEDEIKDRLRGIIVDPLATVSLEQGRSFQFTVYGAVSGTGIYSLDRPDFRVMDALALAGGTMSSTQDIFVIREVALTDMVKPVFNRGQSGESSESDPGEPKTDDEIERLIQQLESDPGSSSEGSDSSEAPSSPGMLRQDQEPFVDLDDVEPDDAKKGDSAAGAADPSAGSDFRRAPGASDDQGGKFRFDKEREQWVPIAGGEEEEEMLLPIEGEDEDMSGFAYATRIIQVDYQRLARGDSNLNIVIRPGDRVYVDPPLAGVVYIDGEINRPGVYALPTTGRLTLSRLVSAAGGLGQIAIPERVDLVRKVGDAREAAIRVNLSAIRNRAEPDIYMQPDDHIIIGTNFWAQPLAVVRNGFRATYGFGFLLDRNFGNDVFGPPPTNIGNFN